VAHEHPALCRAGELWALAWQAHQEDPGGKSDLHRLVLSRVVPVFLCPSEPRQTGTNGNGWTWGLTSYLGVAGTGVRREDGVFHPNYPVRFGDITDGTSNTVMIGERPPGPKGYEGGWYASWGFTVCPVTQILAGTRNPPSDIGCPFSTGALRPGQPDNPCDRNHFWSLHPGGAHFAFADGSVRFLSYTNSETLPALATRDGGEIASVE
jgi:prepilin-type processing-associated H-X9-DG protein